MEQTARCITLSVEYDLNKKCGQIILVTFNFLFRGLSNASDVFHKDNRDKLFEDIPKKFNQEAISESVGRIKRQEEL